MSKILNIWSALLLAATATARAQSYDLRVAPEEGVRVGIEFKNTVNGFRNLNIGGNTHSSEVKIKEGFYLVDRFEKVEEKRILMTRKFARYTRDEGGQVKDPEITGLSVAFEHDKESGEHHLELLGERKVRPHMLDFLLAQSNSIGLFLDLPPAVPLARHFEIDCSGLLPLFLNGGGKQQKSDFVLESFDPTARVGRLVGSLIAESTATDGVLETTTNYSGVCTITVNQKIRRVTEISWEGIVHFTGGNENIAITGNGDFAFQARSKDGDSVEEQFRAAPEYRNVDRVVSQLAVKLTLPSHWYAVERPQGDKTFVFQSTVTGVRVDLELSNRPTKNPRQMVDKIEEEIRTQYPAAEFAASKTTVGDGRSITFHEAGTRFTLVLLPHGQDRLFQMRVIRSADADDPMAKELKTILGTLTPLD